MLPIPMTPTQSRIGGSFGLLVCLSLIGACDASAPTEETAPPVVSVELALSHTVNSPACPHAFGAPDVRSIRLRILDGAVDDLDAATAVFDTNSASIAPDGCLSFEQCTSASVSMDAVSDLSWEERAEACIEANGQLIPATTIQVTDLVAHSDMTAVVEAFSDDTCAERIFVGVRGGIKVGLGDSAPYHITPLCVGHFTALPHPNPDEFAFVRSVATSSCERDCDCIDAFKTTLGVQCTDAQKETVSVPGAPLVCDAGQCTTEHGFEALLVTPCETDEECLESYPHAACREGSCEPTSYYPLNTKHPRAFHSAIESEEGRILFAGGLARSNEGIYTAVAIEPVSFDPLRMLFLSLPFTFEEGTGTNHTGRAFAHARAATTSSGKVVGISLAGGFQSVNIDISPEDGTGLSLAVPVTGPGGGANLRSNVLTIRPNTQDAGTAVYPLSVIVSGTDTAQPIAMTAGELVPNDHEGSEGNTIESTQHIHVGGIVPGGSPAASTALGEDNGITYGNMAINCVFGEGDAAPSANCKGSRNVFLNSRAGATTACFERRESDGACTQFTVIGGAQAPDARVGEVFRRKTKSDGSIVDSFDPLDTENATPLNRAKFVTQHVTGPGEITLFGGTSGPGFGSPANVPTIALTLSGYEDLENNPELLTLEVNTDALEGGNEATYRSHHASAPLPGNRILVTGGLSATNQSTSSALIYNANSHAYEAGALEMAHPRFGHAATAISRGPLKGAVLISGGLTMNGEEEHPIFVLGAEIFIPAATD